MNGMFRLPLIPIFATYTVGLYIGHSELPFSFQGWIFVFFILLTSWTLFLATGRTALGSWIAFCLFLFIGIFSIQTYLHPPHPPSHISNFTGLDRTSLEGIIESSPHHSQGGVQLLIRPQKIILSNRHLPVEGRLLLFLRNEKGPFRVGDRLRFLCKLYPPRGFHNPGGFSYERHLAFQRIHTIGFLNGEKEWVKTGEGFKNPFILQIEVWRDRIRNFIDREVDPLRSGIFKAFVLGEQDDIPDEVKEYFIASGVAHLLAISGDHLGIVALLSFSLLFWVMKRSPFLLLSISVKKGAAGLSIFCILLYTFIAGGGLSVVRATIMVTLFFLSILFGRGRNLLHTLALAAFLILLFSPPSLFDVSFQLSFLAVFSILYLVPPLFHALKSAGIPLFPKSSWKHTILNYFKISLLATGVAILGTAPFVALHFNRFSPVGFFSNLFVIPWVGFLIVPLSLIASLFSFFFYPFAALLIHINEWIAEILLIVVAFFASLPYASLFVSTPTFFEIILFYSLLVLLVHLRKRRGIQYLFAGLCMVFVLNLTYWNLKDLFQKDLKLTFMDVGHGDAILIEFPKGKKMLVDGGGLHGDRFDIGKNVIAPFLWKKKIRRIDILVLSHPDPDHFKGLQFISSQFSIGQFWDNGLRGDSDSYRHLEEILLRKRVERLSLNENSPSRRINGVEISFLNPPCLNEAPRRGWPPLDRNKSSLVIKLQFRNISVLLPGDIEKETEERLLRTNFPLMANILKVPHHGSSSSSSSLFLQRVKPDYGILSVGERNTGKLPHPEVLKRYQQLGTKIFRTDHQGAITVTTDGEKIKLETFLKDES